MLNYEKITTLSETAKSRVFLATMPEHRGPVIIKEMSHASLHVYEQLRGINSPFFPQIYACEAGEELCVIAEEYVEGEPLDVYVKKHALSEDGYLDLFLQICQGVSILHAATPPIIHRDLKPGNLLVDRHGQLHIIDFDASRNYTASTRKDTRLLGTEGYAAPEQFGYSQTDVRSDIYAIGATMYELLFGQSFPKEANARNDRTLPESSAHPRLARRLLPVIVKCTRFAPEQRYANVADLTQALTRCRRPALTKWYLAASACLLAVLAGIGLLCLSHGSKTRDSVLLASSDAGDRQQTGTKDKITSAASEHAADSEDRTIFKDSENSEDSTTSEDSEDSEDRTISEVSDDKTASEDSESSGDGTADVPFLFRYLQSDPSLTPFYQSLDFENGAAPVELVLCTPDMQPVMTVPENCWEYGDGQLLHISDDFLCGLAPDREYILSIVFRTTSHRLHLYPMSTADTVLLQTGPTITPGYAGYSLSHPRPLTFAAVHPLGRRILSVRLSGENTALSDDLCAISADGTRFTLSEDFYRQFPAWSSTRILVHFADSDIFTCNADTEIEIVIIE